MRKAYGEKKKKQKKRETSWVWAVPRSGSGVCTIVKGRKCLYLGPFAMNKKTKDTLVSQTLKVEEKKVSLDSIWG